MSERFRKLRWWKSVRHCTRSTFGRKHVEDTPASECFWGLRWWYRIRRCGAKSTSKSTGLRSNGYRAVGTPKKCTQWYRETHCEVKMLEAPQRRTIFRIWDIKKMRAVIHETHFQGQTRVTQHEVLSDVCHEYAWRWSWQARRFRVSPIEGHSIKSMRSTFCSLASNRNLEIASASTRPLAIAVCSLRSNNWSARHMYCNH